MNIRSCLFAAVGLSVVATASSAQSISCDTPYTVKSGDTLGAISSRAFGPGQLRNFYQLNASAIGPDMNKIAIGMILQVPCSLTSAQTSVTPQATPSPTQPTAPQIPASTDQANFAPAPLDAASQEAAQTQAPAPQGAEVLLTFNKTSAPKFIINVGVVDLYLDKIREVTNGRVQFVDPPVVNRDARAQMDIVTTGQVDAAYVFNGYLSDSHPLLQLPMQPLMGGTAYQTAVALTRLHREHLSKSNYFPEAKLMGFVGAPAAHIWRLREAPVVPGEDLVKSNEYTVPYFDGLDTRGAPAVREENASWLADYDEKKGSPLTFAMAHGAARAGGIWNENRTVTEIPNGVYTPTFSIIMSNDAWGRISETDQKAIDEISGDWLASLSANWDEFDNGHRRIMIEQGLDITKADVDLLAELQDRSRQGLDDWILSADRLGIAGYDAFQFYNETLQAVAKPSEF